MPTTHAYLMLLGDRLWHPNDIFKQYPEINKIFFFHALGVRPEYRKCGIAKQLVRKGFEVFSSVGWEPTFWQAKPSFLIRQAKPSFFQKSLAKPSFRFSKIEQFLTIFSWLFYKIQLFSRKNTLLLMSSGLYLNPI